ncbi:MAG: regulatory protein RecX [Bacteroidia bacterium]|nr:regulatory protein RecX [Bacteroidia bacterium]
MEEKKQRIYSSLENLCAKREYCTSDIYRKALDRLEGDSAAAEEMVAELVADGFVSDLRYASAFAREKASLTGWGPVKIRFALSAKHIGSDVIDEALGEIDTEKADARLERLIEAKRRSLEGDPQIRLKLIKFALSRGYDYDTVKKFVG